MIYNASTLLRSLYWSCLTQAVMTPQLSHHVYSRWGCAILTVVFFWVMGVATQTSIQQKCWSRRRKCQKRQAKKIRICFFFSFKEFSGKSDLLWKSEVLRYRWGGGLKTTRPAGTTTKPGTHQRMWGHPLWRCLATLVGSLFQTTFNDRRDHHSYHLPTSDTCQNNLSGYSL